MCGIAGIWDVQRLFSKQDFYRTLEQATATMANRGPDSQGVWTSEADGIGLGFRRLAILDLSDRASQPMHSTCGRYSMVFNGEVYNFQDLRDELSRVDSTIVFKTTSDTEVILQCFVTWGIPSSLEKFNGMFAIGLWDHREHKLHLMRDRFGKKPLYYGWVGSSLVFGSELSLFKKVPGFNNNIDRDALALFLQYSYVPTPFSIYKDIYKLPAGCSVELTKQQALEKRIAPQTYFNMLDWNAPRQAPVAQQELEELLTDSVRIRMVSDVPLGAFLSGGVDSSLIVALMQKLSAKPIRTFAIGFNEGSHNEADFARAVARHLGTEHTELIVSASDALKVVPDLAQIYDEPFADSSQIPTYLVSKLARHNVTVALSGDAGDELFGGYNRYFLSDALWHRLDAVPLTLRKSMALVLEKLPVGSLAAILESLSAVLPKSLRIAQPRDKIAKILRVLAAKDLAHLYRSLTVQAEHPAYVIGASKSPTYADSLHVEDWNLIGAEYMMMRDLVSYLVDDILVKVDRASMAASLEARNPFLDPRVVKLAWSMPLSQKMSGGVGKRPLRDILYKYVPRELIERPKVGFAIPLEAWLKGPLRPMANDRLSKDRLSRDGFFDAQALARVWHEHLSGAKNHQQLIWNVVIFNQWLQSNR